ncbi:hypothetical protein GLOTRDRAFT_38919 [Gloeophyllum trabeum ATCC 11539]|uniref:U3 small nucleolar RNA-associated protein 6 N-terminal domain-containing protein n=1 Tax=Gloeophyllum trabeum (strain ATCC 11539 / FP-39264 / Madison 617) TaxID=670483 RepID=S7QDK7_GLOTA|nr:uncharacterized protein GLOTRDRAFT_38919 [Gloeophyllum trabeum ATCC 11539]EPQ57473.1 hypothetical protein GLOTRDRAFT_38919 [Gloeophyllum trabeum ATCC 11539]
MERVQFQQEQMLAELKDLVQKGLFTQNETKQIMKKRTAFETALVRRIPKKADFLRYAAYEMGLEALRKKRIERLNIKKSEPSISDFALVRRQFHIFERALQKFKGDVALWIQYIELAKKEGARALVGRITARALQLHPTHPPLYVLAAQHELSRLSPSAARTLLQRGIRLNPESVDMWREYVKMEMGWLESVRRRWSVLGLTDDKGKGKETGKKGISRVLGGEGEEPEADGEGMDVDGDAQVRVEGERGDESEAARKEILEGAIVKAVISSAVKAIPTLPLFTSLHTALTTYPSPPSLRASLLEHLYTLLRQTLPAEPGAVHLLSQRFFYEQGEGSHDLVEALRNANEEMMRGKGESRRQGMEREYAEFVASWCNKPDLDDHLKLYLLSSLHSLISQSPSPSPLLLGAHLRLLTQLRPSTYPDKKLLKLARKYTSQQNETKGGWAFLWLARLQIESEASDSQEVRKAWDEARRKVDAEEDPEAAQQVWMWGLEQPAKGEAVADAEKSQLLETLLRESMRSTGLRGVHEELLLRYVGLHQKRSGVDVQFVRRVSREYFVSCRVWGEVFRLLAEGEDADGKVLEAVHEEWRRVDLVAACIEYARWLIAKGKGDKASELIARTRTMADASQRVVLEERWREVLEGPQIRGEEESAE